MSDGKEIDARIRGAQALAANYRAQWKALPDTSRNRWILFVKEMRLTHGVGIFDAERIALSDPVWRRWVERQIDTNGACRKAALSHIRHHGENALIERVGETFEFNLKAL